MSAYAKEDLTWRIWQENLLRWCFEISIKGEVIVSAGRMTKRMAVASCASAAHRMVEQPVFDTEGGFDELMELNKKMNPPDNL